MRILVIYAVDVHLSHDRENYWELIWAKLIVVCITLNGVDMLVSIILHSLWARSYLLRFGALLRLMFLVTRSQFLRATCRSIVHSIPRVLDVVLLVCLYILFFAVLGYVLFSQHHTNNARFVRKMTNIRALGTIE